MFILLTLGIFILKYLALGVIGLFFMEDLELTKEVGSTVYTTYLALATISFVSLFLFILGKRILWLAIFLICGTLYLGMYNTAPTISEIHQEHDLKSRYFKDSHTFISRMTDVVKIINK